MFLVFVNTINKVEDTQKLSSRGALWKTCSLKFCNIHRKIPTLVTLFNKVAGAKACDFIEKRLQHRCFPVNIAKFLRAYILKNICQRLLLDTGRRKGNAMYFGTRFIFKEGRCSGLFRMRNCFYMGLLVRVL